jgi:hypothetical protein
MRVVRALRNQNYRRYFAANFVSNTGNSLHWLAQDWLVLRLSGSGIALGVTTGLQFLPILILVPYGGVLADRVAKRSLLQVTQLGMAMPSLMLGRVAIFGLAKVWMVYVLIAGFGIASALDAPARQSFVSEMVEREDLASAVGLNAMSENVARMLGPAIAGLFIGALGDDARACGWVTALNGLTYFLVILQLRRMDFNHLLSASPLPRVPGMLSRGLQYVRSRPDFVMVLMITLFVGAFSMSMQVTLALMATRVFNAGAGAFGPLGSALAVGSLAGAFLGAWRSAIRLRLMVLSGTGYGIAQIVAGLQPSYLAFACVAPVMGYLSMTAIYAANGFLQLASDPAMRGRVMAHYVMAFVGAVPVSSAAIGTVGEALGPRWALVGSGLVVLLGVGLALVTFKVVTRRRRLRETALVAAR